MSLQINAAPGRLDWSFPQLLAGSANVMAIEAQTDGKILVAGQFTTRGAVVRNDMIRINADGSLDAAFNIGSVADYPRFFRVIKQQPDGKILIAGYINQINGTLVRSLVRLNANGSIDSTFNLSGIDVTFVYDLDIQTDGKILISASNLIGSSFITRLKTDGSNDQGIGQPLFNNGSSGYTLTYVPAENKILVGGRILVRLNIDGSIDQTFNAVVTNSVYDLLIKTKMLGNGKILIYGKFDSVNQTTRKNIAILNNDGSLDSSFNPATVGSENILSVAVQTNGKIIIGGNSFPSNTILRGNIARLNVDGTADKTFNQGRGANGDVNSMIIRNNSKLLIGGTFFRYHIFPRSGLAQIYL
ncbi:MAG: delta-60 repeat domain-containing protein [Acidobacteriota bacterium]